MASRNLFWPGATTSINATTTTANAALPRAGGVIRLANTGSTAVFVVLGTSGVTATLSTGFPILPGTAELFTSAQDRAGSSQSPTHFAAITETGTSRVSATIGEGEL
jgi:hypothetical protein